ncbi:MAG: hypothetical protein ABOK23_04790 [Candidatus Methanoperedens sp.]|nr:hypothetical protein [Candidatus Methanoperedens sp.]MCZ7394430.1 hypothetical protein [Candidatus Methanoperedens sp.]
MNIDVETIAKKVDALESKISELEKPPTPRIIDANTKKIKDALKRYFRSSSEIRTLWKGRLSAVEEVRAMRRHARGY